MRTQRILRIGGTALALTGLGNLNVDAGGGFDLARNEQPVFQHICESPTLPSILRIHNIDESHSQPPQSQFQALCVVADFGFLNTRIRIELYPVPEAGQLMIFDRVKSLEEIGRLQPLLMIQLTDNHLRLEGRGFPAIDRPWRPGNEWRFWLLLAEGRLTILEDGSERPVIPNVEIEVYGPVYLAVPSAMSSCSDNCGPTAMDIYLHGGESRRWKRALKGLKKVTSK